jgi:hypothetical protein
MQPDAKLASVPQSATNGFRSMMKIDDDIIVAVMGQVFGNIAD